MRGRGAELDGKYGREKLINILGIEVKKWNCVKLDAEGVHPPASFPTS